MEIYEFLASIFSDFFNPKKRVFFGYLLLSLLIAFAWLIFIRRENLSRAISRVFDGKIFFSNSAKSDYKIFVLNRVFTMFISPLLLTQIAIATAIYYFLHRQDYISAGAFSDVNQPMIIALFSLMMFVVDDLTKYLVHRWMHRWPLLWAIHKVHHSAETLTPVTVYRVHPLEGILYSLRSAVAQGVTISTFIFLFGNAVDLYTIVGVNVIVFIFHVTGSNLRHSHIDIHYWRWLEYVLISPAQHQLHHSIAKEHYDKNYGVALAIWDWLFGSLHLSEKDKELEFGLTESEGPSETLKDLYLGPFVDMGKVTRRRFRSVKRAFSGLLFER